MHRLPSDVDVYEAQQIIRRAASVIAEDVRMTGYQPADEMSVRCKLASDDGSPQYLPSGEWSWLHGRRLAKAIFNELCDPKHAISIADLDTGQLAGNLADDVIARCGVKSGRVLSKPIRDGFILIVTFTYPAVFAGQRAARGRCGFQ